MWRSDTELRGDRHKCHFLFLVTKLVAMKDGADACGASSRSCKTVMVNGNEPTTDSYFR